MKEDEEGYKTHDFVKKYRTFSLNDTDPLRSMDVIFGNMKLREMKWVETEPYFACIRKRIDDEKETQ